MAITISWFIPGRVILHKVTGGMTAEDIDDMNRMVIENTTASGQRLHQLIDITEMTKPPTIGTLRQHSRPASDEDGYVVIIGKVNRLIEFTITTIAQITNFRVLVVPTLDDAIRQLRTLDPSL